MRDLASLHAMAVAAALAGPSSDIIISAGSAISPPARPASPPRRRVTYLAPPRPPEISEARLAKAALKRARKASRRAAAKAKGAIL